MPAPGREPLFTGRFFVMCGFSFTVFLSAFMLLPTAPFRILALGGSELAAGMFLGLLTYASALSAPFTGSLADRLGKRRMLIVASLAIAGFSAAYAFTRTATLLLLLVPVHGIFWSGLLAASAAYMTDLIPESRRAEGIGYWGLSTIFAIVFAPGLGFWLFEHGWWAVCAAACALNLGMATIARLLPAPAPGEGHSASHEGGMVEWRVVLTSVSLFLYSFGYGGITSFVAVYAQRAGVEPKGLYFTAIALVIIATRPLLGPLADRKGHLKVFVPCLALIAIGLGMLAVEASLPWLLASALVFGTGFGTAYPVYAAWVMKQVSPRRRGAAFGGILAAFDTGIGTGSIAIGWIAQHHGFRVAFGSAAALSLLSIPYFLWVTRRYPIGRPTAA